jgi:outer membrane protein OmpA-like peptidoglycan-associated protein
MALSKTTKIVLVVTASVLILGVGTYLIMNRPKNKKDEITDEIVKDVFDNLNFEFGKADIKKESLPYLDKLVETLLKENKWTLEIQGHTDDKGSDEYNLKLSQNRANSVKKYLVSKGVSADVITAIGFGESKPLVPNDSDSNREKNRRVEFKVTKPNNEVITTENINVISE